MLSSQTTRPAGVGKHQSSRDADPEMVCPRQSGTAPVGSVLWIPPLVTCAGSSLDWFRVWVHKTPNARGCSALLHCNRKKVKMWKHIALQVLDLSPWPVEYIPSGQPPNRVAFLPAGSSFCKIQHPWRCANPRSSTISVSVNPYCIGLYEMWSKYRQLTVCVPLFVPCSFAHALYV